MNLHERVLARLGEIMNPNDRLHVMLWDVVEGHRPDAQLWCTICGYDQQGEPGEYCLLVRRVALAIGVDRNEPRE